MDQFCSTETSSVARAGGISDLTLRRGGQLDLQPLAAYRAEVVLANFEERLARLGAKALDPPQSFAATTHVDFHRGIDFGGESLTLNLAVAYYT